MTGFSKSTVTVIELPELPPHAPFLFDDCSLAFTLRIRVKTLWWILLKPNKQYAKSTIRKKQGSRVIHKPTPTMKAILRRANERILGPLHAQLGNHVTAYRPGRSARDAVLQHIPVCPVCDAQPKDQTAPKHDCPRRGTCIQMDLRDFFPSTRRAWVRNYFKSLGYGHDVASYLAGLLTVTNIPNQKHFTGKEKAYRKFFTGVPQGAPTSGALCNLVADHRLDRHIHPLLNRWNAALNLSGESTWRYTRYSDDLTVSCGKILSENTVAEIKKDLIEVITEAGYRINPRKTRCTSGWRQRRYLLGMTFNQHPNYRVDKYRTLRAIVYNCASKGFDTQYEKAGFSSTDQLVDWLRGTINWVAQINPDKGRQLLQTFLPAVAAHTTGAET